MFVRRMMDKPINVWLPVIAVGTGTDVYTRRLATALEAAGFRVHIRWFPRYFELLPEALALVTPPQGTDVIIANSWNGFAFKRKGIPLVVVVHHASFEASLLPYKNPLQRWYHRLLARPREARSLRVADAVICVSDYVASVACSSYGVRAPQVVRHWVDTECFSPAPTSARLPGSFRLLYVGKLSRLKGADLLAPLMQRLGAGFELKVTASESECRQWGVASASALGRLDKAGLVGAYRWCDALLFPSRTEGFGYVALEAMACGKPVIAGDIPALREVVGDSAAGILCASGDVEAFAVACRALTENPGACEVMGTRGRQAAIEAGRHAALYGELLGRLVRRGY